MKKRDLYSCTYLIWMSKMAGINRSIFIKFDETMKYGNAQKLE